ncbi:hypothetical protein KIW84_053419 [Lathyrus oleraceus]|uniref:Uncharacterized protein n=1 Tax=Pisum sativum TaxID=3888 RepID=A0A9D4WQE1_PEA|nr:hypothetical protein KIW84_053419 [Pisum sativum]
MAKKSQKIVEMELVNPSSPWEGSIYSPIISIFSKEGSLNIAYFEVGELSLWGLTILGEDDIVCSEYDNLTIPLYEYLFKTLGVHLPFTIFEEGESLCRSVFSSFSLQPGYSCSTKRAGVGPVSTEDTYFQNLSRITTFRKPKKKLMVFVGLLGYTRGLAPLDEDGKKCLECLIDVSLLVGSGSHKGHRAVLVIIEEEVRIWVLNRGMQPPSIAAGLPLPPDLLKCFSFVCSSGLTCGSRLSG